MKYDMVISLGQWCFVSFILRELGLQQGSLPFDWSGGVLEEKCGRGGIWGKVNLICNNFESFFLYDDFENKGPNKDGDQSHLWMINNRTGLQYKHDFYSDTDVISQFDDIKEKYNRRIKRLYDKIQSSQRILFLFISTDDNYNDSYLFDCYNEISQKYYNKKIDFLYIINSKHMECENYSKRYIAKNVCRVDMNVTFYDKEDNGRAWLGNADNYCKIIKDFVENEISVFP